MGLKATRITTPWKALIMAVVVAVMKSALMASVELAGVVIYNMLPDLLQIHCQFNRSDLKTQVLVGNVNGSPAPNYSWYFYYRTTYWCNFKWPAGGKRQYFAVWAQPGTQENLSECVYRLWIVERHGFYILLDVDHQYSPQMKLIKPWLSVF